MTYKSFCGKGKTLDKAKAEMYKNAEKEGFELSEGPPKIKINLFGKGMNVTGDASREYEKAFDFALKKGGINLCQYVENNDKYKTLVFVEGTFRCVEEPKKKGRKT